MKARTQSAERQAERTHAREGQVDKQLQHTRDAHARRYSKRGRETVGEHEGSDDSIEFERQFHRTTVFWMTTGTSVEGSEAYTQRAAAAAAAMVPARELKAEGARRSAAELAQASASTRRGRKSVMATRKRQTKRKNTF